MKIRGNTVGTPMKPEKNLVKATDLTEKEKEQARENIGAPHVYTTTEKPTDSKHGDFWVRKVEVPEGEGDDPVIPDGYYVTEDQMKKYVANAIPKTLPNPHALTFTGAVEGSYDGSKPLSIEIPQGCGSEKPMELLYSTTTTEDALEIRTGINPNDYNEILMIARAVSSDNTKSTHFVWHFINRADSYEASRVTGGLHNTQIRSFLFHAKKVSDGNWLINSGGSQYSADRITGEKLTTGLHANDMALTNNVATNIGCGAYIYGGTLLAAGAELMVFGR